jgi:tryptophan synthase alpha chain
MGKGDAVTTIKQDRLSRRFSTLKNTKKDGFIPFITAGDPDYDTSLKILKSLPGCGASIIELGMPFSDPMADGPSIQLSSKRALDNGQNMGKTLDMVRAFRADDADTPLVLMGYYNPIYAYGADKFIDDAITAGVDAVIIVDLPCEEDDEFCIKALNKGLHFVRLCTPTTDDARLETVLENTSGFIYYVSICGITGSGGAPIDDIRASLHRIRQKTDLPVVVGFGLRDSDNIKKVADIADAAVVGSAIVDKISEALEKNAKGDAVVTLVTDYVRVLTSKLQR